MKVVKTAFLLALLTACGSGKNTDEQAMLNSIDSAGNKGPHISEAVIDDLLQEIPSPLEISVLLKESGKKYNVDYLNSADNIARYNNNFQKAMNLGIYGTDLGYTNIYEKNTDGIKYMTSIKGLADDLNIGQFFDLETISRLATNSKNLDSLLLITTQNFNNINHYFQTQNRSNLSVLLLTGGWLEAMHITCSVAASDPKNKELNEKIGEQKIILEKVLKLLSFYKDTDAHMASLLTDLQGLEEVYKKVNITYTYKESSFVVVDGVMVIKDNSTTTVDITPEQVAEIKNISTSIRNKIIS
ncbi:MAG TPA: hypothetical protein PK325_06910 [Cyclobacteriaceae bacterium]|nr:hypothetical protein [Cyclobacteriaceae bacterium]HMV09035.1 hypothetical protein [Cyclobacteriaceae bacterium]HMV89879.1 hypothetical protein [Cyclobacteriaceae bacterium]HMW99560.1 hypothetical protein [Cyclobacteriaceae bacterium]HMX51657.1 hypothetical protein [Cyclobacteriaceae bacterium]